MIARQIGAALPILGWALGVAPAAAQDGGQARAPAATVTLDQVPAGPDRATALDVAQPPRPARAASVIAAELSDQAQGRVLMVTPLDGDDRCDPGKGANHAPVCRQRLETRAGQYGRPGVATVTPEARLLLLTNPNGGATAGDPGRGLGTAVGLDAPNGPAAQLAGALRDQTATQTSADTTGQAGASGTLPGSVPSIVVIPPK